MTKCSNMAEIRDNIDRLDRIIVPLLVERAGFVKQAAGFKPTKADVVVPDRIEAIVLKVRHMANELDCDPDLIERIYRSMIDAYIMFEAEEWTHLNGENRHE